MSFPSLKYSSAASRVRRHGSAELAPGFTEHYTPGEYRVDYLGNTTFKITANGLQLCQATTANDEFLFIVNRALVANDYNVVVNRKNGTLYYWYMNDGEAMPVRTGMTFLKVRKSKR